MSKNVMCWRHGDTMPVHKLFLLACFVFCLGCGEDRWIEVTVIQENRQVYYQTDSGIYDKSFTNTLVEDSQRRRHRCLGRWGKPGDKFLVNSDARYFLGGK